MNKRILVVGLILIIVGIIGFIVFKQKSSSPSLYLNPTDTMTQTSNATTTRENLAGTISPYLEFTKVDYDKALSENKIIIINFYANWCPICRAEAPEIEAAFEALSNPNFIGFRVNFNDSETDDDEKELAKQFKIPYQHTKVILKNGAEVKRISEQVTKDELVSEINEIL